MAVAKCFAGVFCDISCHMAQSHLAGRCGVQSLEELVMRKGLTFFLTIVVCLGALIAPSGYAAEKFYVVASETFDPEGLVVQPPVGSILAFPTVKCPGHEPTTDPMQPCPVGSRTHTRDFVVVSRVDSEDASMSGDMTVELNANLDANLEGPVWGKFSLALDSGGTWEGTWHGTRVAEGELWTAMLHVRGKGFGGMVDGMILMAEDYIVTPTPVPIVYFGTIQGRILDPK